MMKVEIINKETIKPSTPTPTRLRTYKISLLDQITPSLFTPLILIYPNADNNVGDHFLRTLKNSLSETLSLFRPLAGRIKDNVSVDCNDEGVPCYETRVRSTLSQLMEHKDIESMNYLLVAEDDVHNVDTGPQLLVQINVFECGGIALGVSFSHKLCDANTFATFLKSWSARAVNSGRGKIYQLVYNFIFNRGPNQFVPTFFPPRENVSATRPVVIPPAYDGTITRLVFNGPDITALKVKSASKSTQQPTRVEAVTALIVKCAMAASKTIKEGYTKPYVLTHTVNMRKTVFPILPQTTFGNVYGVYFVQCPEQSDAGLDTLVDKMRKERTEYHGTLRKVMTGSKPVDEYMQEVEKETAEMKALELFIFTSWCRYGFYEADFGLGKPAWVGTGGFPRMKNLTIFIDTKDGNGIEAYVTLDKQVMTIFEADPILLRYASVNPATYW